MFTSDLKMVRLLPWVLRLGSEDVWRLDYTKIRGRQVDVIPRSAACSDIYPRYLKILGIKFISLITMTYTHTLVKLELSSPGDTGPVIDSYVKDHTPTSNTSVCGTTVQVHCVCNCYPKISLY